MIDGWTRTEKRAAVVAVVGIALVGWGLFVPLEDWNSTNGTIFGVISVFMLSMGWVLSGDLVDP